MFTIDQYKCERRGHIWIPSSRSHIVESTTSLACKSRFWNKPQQEKKKKWVSGLALRLSPTWLN